MSEQKVGRNDPCYCGSGLKYKQCHLKIDQSEQKKVREGQLATRFLRRDLLRFARDERFTLDVAAALPLYWDGLYDKDNAELMSQDEALRFFDWFVFDYLPADGRPLIDIYAEEAYADLSTAQQKVVEQWKNAPPTSGYELLAYEGQTLSLRDYFSGDEFEVFEPGGHGDVNIGEVIITRIVPVQDRLEFSTTAAYLPAAEIKDIKDKMAAAKEEFLTANPDAAPDEFMRQHNHLIVHHALAEAQAKGRPPVARQDPKRPDKIMQKLAHRMGQKQRRRR
jgi:hypothetical protein